MPDVVVCEVGPRDGLQNDAVVLPPPLRAELCRRLAGTGAARVEAVSFVSDRRVPAMAGAERVLEALDRGPDEPWSGLVLNDRGLSRALGAGLRRVNLTVAVTERFCHRSRPA